MAPSVTEQYLLPATSLQAFVERVEQRGEPAGRAQLSDAWRAAREAMLRLEEREAGCADDAAVLTLPEDMGAHVAAVARIPEVDRGFAHVPVMFGLIELDATMCARHVLVEETLSALKAAWPEDLDDVQLVAACLPLSDWPVADTRASFHGRTLTVITDDDGLHWSDSTVVSRAAAAAVAGSGVIDAGLQLLLGRTPPLMHAIRMNGRLLLVEGHHRARVLRASGQAFAPCIVSSCIDLDEVRAAVPSLADTDLGRYFEASRPPMLRDFDRQALVYRYRARRLRRMLQLKIDVTTQWLP